MIDTRSALAAMTCAAAGALGAPAAAQFDFVSTTSYPISLDEIGRSFCADMDGINGPDVVVADFDIYQIVVARNDGTGDFFDFATVGSGPQVLAVAPADWDNDGLMDVLSVNGFGGGELRLFRQTSVGVWAVQSTLALPGMPSDLAVGDIDGNGLVDVAVVNDTSVRIDVYLNDGSGSLAALTADSYIAGLVTELELCDLDADGDLDMLACVPAGPAVRRWFNDGTGDLGTSIGLTVGADPVDIVCADLSGDGRPDLATTNSNDDTISIHLNNGIGGFFAATTHAVGPSPGAIVASDFDCDGRVDLAFVEDGPTLNDHLSILRNDGSGSWTYVPNVIDVTDEVFDLDAAELDGEAGTDIVSFAVHAFGEFRTHFNVGGACGICIDPPPGVQAWYTGDDCLPPDLLGNHDGSIVGLPFCAAHWKVGGGAIGCSAGGTYVTVPGHCDLVPGDGDYTVNGWVRSNGTGFQPIVAAGFAPGYSVDFFNGQARVILCDDTFCWNLTGTSFINDGDWHHVAFTLDRGPLTSVILYVDGVRENTLSASIGAIGPTSPFLLGASGSLSSFLDGDIDELQVHDRVLDAAEIHAIVLAGIAGQCRTPCTPTVPDGTCSEPTELEEMLAGVEDEFTGLFEVATPGAALSALCTSSVGFDADPAGGSVCHTFIDVPGDVIAATLELRLRAGGTALACDDTIDLQAVGGGFEWSRRIGTPETAACGTGAGLIDCSWDPTDTRTFCLDLDALPLTGSGTTSLIDSMTTLGRLDLRVRDGTLVDFARLRLLRCPCTGDIGGDGTVDVGDLVAVILAWGPCPDPCPPNCPEDVNGDCVVDVVDLVTVLLAWGPCG